jgi:hypothetical protein
VNTLRELFRSIRRITSPVTDEQLRPLEPYVTQVQFDQPLTSSDFDRLSAFMYDYPDVMLRVFGHHSTDDLEFLRFFPSHRAFTVDVWTIKDITGLRHLSENATSIGIGWTKTKSLSLSVLSRFKNLQRLSLEGQTKDIAVISALVKLEDVTLRSVTLPDLEILGPLKQLWSLDVKLGGTKDISVIKRLPALKYLELWMIRGFTDLSHIAEAEVLQYFWLEALKNVNEIPSLRNLTALRRVMLSGTPGLRDLCPIADAPALEELFVDVRGREPADFACFKGHQSLRYVFLGPSKTKNDKVRRMLGLPEDNLGPFKYR